MGIFSSNSAFNSAILLTAASISASNLAKSTSHLSYSAAMNLSSSS